VNSGRDRDGSVERLLQRSLAHGAARASDASNASNASNECPDAETLAAWVDGGLDKRAMTLVEAHASECARCQALLAAVGQTAPDPTLPAWQGAWLRGWGLRWLVPLAATAAAAVIIWIVVPNGDRPGLPEQARVELPTAAPIPPQPEARTDRFNAQAAPPNQPATKDETKTAKANDVGASEREQRKENAIAAGQPATEPVDALSAREGGAPAAPEALSRSAPSVAQQGRQSLGLGGGVTSIEITSPDPSVRWRIRGAASVEHTTNGGTTWEAAPTGVDAALTAGASPSPLVCWLIGRAGTVLLSTDGRTWRRVPFPEMTDLVTVQASDAQTTTVTTTDGRTFRTTDSGRTWARLQGF
jgi:hypothetical protein